MIRLFELLQRLLSLLKVRVLLYSKPRMVGTLPKVQKMAEEVIKRMFDEGHAVMVFQGYRSCDEQNYLYEQGRTRPGPIVTNAKCGESKHNYGVAVDIVFIVNGKPSWSNGHPWDLLGRIGEEVGFEWGGRWEFQDRPHFQLK